MQTMHYCRNFLLIFSFFAFTSTSPAYDLPEADQPDLNKDRIVHLKEISRGISEISKHARKGVVFVSVSKVVQGSPYGGIDPFEFFFGPGFNGGRGGPQRRAPEQRQEGLGSGFIVDTDKGYIITNNHVIEGADEIHVKLANEQTYAAKVVGRDKNTDVAVVQIIDKNYNKKGLTALSLADSTKVEVGDLCIALGAPFGLESSISFGVVSAMGRGSLGISELGDFIQTDAAINPGNSGGPLLSTEGLVMGMNTAIYSKSGGYNGIGFAIPANLVRAVANQLINDGKVERGYLGVLLSELDQEMAKEMGIPEKYRGALLRSVEPNSPAAKAKLEAGDVVVEVEGKEIDNVQHLRNIVGLHKPGKVIEMTYYRNGKKQTAKVTLGNYNDASVAENSDDQTFDFGLELSNINVALRRQYGFKSNDGVVVLAVEPNSNADRAGLTAGDLIVKLNNSTINSVDSFRKLAKNKKRLLLRVERQGRYLFIPLKN